MPCLHKFSHHLNLERLGFKPRILIVGTFNPSWDCLGNGAQWFYGRTHNNYFWEVLPRLYGVDSLRAASVNEWQQFCRQYQIALTDFLYCIEDADEDNPRHIGYLKTYRDDAITRYFNVFKQVDICGVLEKHPTITHIYFTRQSSGFWQPKWQKIVQYSQQHGKTCIPLMTPSGGARFQMKNSTACSLSEFILQRWQGCWHPV